MRGNSKGEDTEYSGNPPPPLRRKENMITKEQREMTSYFSTENMVNRTSSFGRRFEKLYRSQDEYVFAKSLGNMDIPFEFEPYGFKLKNETGIYIHYIPDFYIKNSTLFIELSRNVTRKRRHKILMFQEQYPELTLMLLSHEAVKKWLRGDIDIDFDKYIDEANWSQEKFEQKYFKTL